MAEKSKGQAVLEAVAEWIGSWVVFPVAPEGQSMIMALWALSTWFTPKWPVAAYLHITSDGPGCGKTTLMEVLAALSCNPRKRATVRAPAVVRDIEEQGGAVTYFFDQVEALQARGKISDEQAILLTGYRRGGEHGISVGQRQVSFSTYCAKAFACIGDIAPDLRSRSIVTRLGFGVPARDWSDAVMVRKGEADQLLREASKLFDGNVPTWIAPDFLQGREREIWTPLYSVASAMNLDAATMKAVRRAIEDFAFFKRTVETKSYRDLIGVKKEEGRDEFGERALRDLAAVMPDPDKTHTGHLPSARAIELMKALDGPWRVFQGRGLDVDTLAALVARFGLEPKNIRPNRGRGTPVVRGYKREDVRAAVAKLGD